MIKSSKQFAALSLSAVLISATQAFAAVIISENFGGLGTDPLNGTTADTFNASITTAGGSSTWQAASGFDADGSLGGNGAAFLTVGSYINTAKGSSEAVFTLSATLSEFSGSWGSLGFFDNPVTSNNFTDSGMGVGTIIYRGSGELDGFGGPGSGGAVDGPNSQSGPQLLTVELDLTSHDGATDFGTVSFYQGTAIAANLIGSHSYTADQSFEAIGMSGAGSPTGSYSNLKLEQNLIPEPSTTALLGLAGLALVLRRRK